MKKNFRSLELVAKKYLETYGSGIHPTLLKDSLIDVDVVREYQPGDKRLDSKSSLKTGKTISRVFNPEKSFNLFIILDLSSSQYTKLEESIITALYLCYLGDICGEKVGLCVFSDNIKIIGPSDDYSSVIGLIEKFSMSMERKIPTEDVFKQVFNLNLTNSFFIFISDFCYPQTEIFLNYVKRIAAVPTNSFLNIILYNPLDWFMSLNQSFSIALKDAESGTVSNYDIKSAKSNFENWHSSTKRNLLRCNADSVFLNTKEEKFLIPLVKHLIRG